MIKVKIQWPRPRYTMAKQYPARKLENGKYLVHDDHGNPEQLHESEVRKPYSEDE